MVSVWSVDSFHSHTTVFTSEATLAPLYQIEKDFMVSIAILNLFLCSNTWTPERERRRDKHPLFLFIYLCHDEGLQQYFPRN